MMKIGIAVLDNREGTEGGINIYTRNLVNALADHERSHTYVILTYEHTVDYWAFRQWPDRIKVVGLQTSLPPSPLLNRIRNRLYSSLNRPVRPYNRLNHLASQIDELKLDLIHYPSTTIHPLSIDTPTILTFFDMQQEFYPEFFTPRELEFRARTHRPSIEKASHIIAPSEHTRQTLLEVYQQPSEKVTFIPGGLPASFTRAKPEEVTRVREKYKLPDQFIFYPANPWFHKNHARLMAALRIYRVQYGDIPWLVLSGRLAEERRDAISLAVAAGVEDRVIDLGFLPYGDLRAIYSGATMLIFPSLFEGFGIPLIEAMRCGCPIAAANVTAIPDCVGDAALFFDPQEPAEIAGAIHRLLHDTTLRKQLIERGYQRLDRFDWRNILPQLVELYETIIAG